MMRLLRPLTALLGFVLLTANAPSALALASAENRASGSATVSDTLASQNTRLSEDAVRENLTLRYDLASDSPVAAEGVAVTSESLNALANGERIGSALQADAFHIAPTFADSADVAASGQQFSLTGGDGVVRTLVQSPGTVNDIAGRFEWIINSDGTISHQLFVRGGGINGIPIQP